MKKENNLMINFITIDFETAPEDIGGINSNSVTKDPVFLIVGQQDLGLSAKMG